VSQIELLDIITYPCYDTNADISIPTDFQPHEDSGTQQWHDFTV